MDKLSNLPSGQEILIIRAMTPAEKQDAFQVRQAVFIGEQGVPADLESDPHDEQQDTTHFAAYFNGEPVGAARLRKWNDKTGKVERVAVLESYRKAGVGAALMDKLEQTAMELGLFKLKLNAQLHAKSFYLRLGYHPVGEVFLEANIEHIAMEKKLA
jgi:predicted GNAT family N-acyltransferase